MRRAMWYNVGSKDEPKGKTGFAHLFEHLMFKRVERICTAILRISAADRRERLQRHDRLRSDQLLSRLSRGCARAALFMDSDRMGYMGCGQPGKLEYQRGVVQNEKARATTSGGPVFYEIPRTFPEGHRTGIRDRSMADLDKASLQTVRNWFTNNYGRIMPCSCCRRQSTTATARPLVEKYFGEIARGPVNTRPQRQHGSLAASKSAVMK